MISIDVDGRIKQKINRFSTYGFTTTFLKYWRRSVVYVQAQKIFALTNISIGPSYFLFFISQSQFSFCVEMIDGSKNVFEIVMKV